MSNLRFISIVATFALGAGCTGPMYVELDGGPTDAAVAPGGLLILLSAPSLAIHPGESAAIEVRSMTPGGAPQADVEVTFAIEGAALDSTLSALSTRTDADGRASGRIVAGNAATSFRVRVVSRGAVRPVYVDIGVGTSFGTLVVRAPYSGIRIVTRRLIDVVPGARCRDLEASPPEVGARAFPEGSDELSIAGLPSTVRYAVLARGQSDLAVTAVGCVDEIALMTDATVRVNVPYVDAPLQLDGRYGVVLALDASGPLGVEVGLFAGAFETRTEFRGGDATVMLDALEAELSSRASTSAGRAFAEARVRDGLDHALSDRLMADASAPTPTLLRWVAAAAEAMRNPVVEGTLVVARPGASVFSADRVTVRDAADGTVTLVPSTFAPPLGELRPLVVAADGSSDSVVVSTMVIDAPLGATTLAWLDAVSRSDGLAGSVGLIAPACGTTRAFAASIPTAGACDAACLAAACEAGLAILLGDLRAAAAHLDATAGDLTLTGALAETDPDGDARVDALTGMLSGSYPAAAGVVLGRAYGSVVMTRATAAP